MAQDLLSISQEAFELQLYSMTNQALINILKNIYEFKWEWRSKMPDEAVLDIERKETKVNKELMRRGYLKKTDYQDYFQFLKKINFKKKVF